jgi:hypothetical protein
MGQGNNAEEQRKYVKKVHTGCTSCNVALCMGKGSNCWKKYHRKFMGSSDPKTVGKWKKV